MPDSQQKRRDLLTYGNERGWQVEQGQDSDGLECPRIPVGLLC